MFQVGGSCFNADAHDGVNGSAGITQVSGIQEPSPGDVR